MPSSCFLVTKSISLLLRNSENGTLVEVETAIRILLDRLTNYIVGSVLSKSQCGFWAGRGTSGMIFVMRQSQKKCREQNLNLYTAFIDLTKAFDTVCCDGLWRILSLLCCSSKFITMVVKKVKLDTMVPIRYLYSRELCEAGLFACCNTLQYSLEQC